MTVFFIALVTKLGHLRLELAYDSRTVKKWAASAGHFRFYHRRAHEQVIPASLQRNKKVPLANGTLQELGHTPLRVVCPRGSDLHIVSHFVTKLLGHLRLELRTKGL